MTNITELKEKLTRWDEVQACIDFGTHFKISKTPPLYIDVLEWQYRKNAKTITALLSIIEEMQKALVRCSKRKIYFKDGGQVRYESGATTTFYKDEEWDESFHTDETLTATEQKLKKLTEEK